MYAIIKTGGKQYKAAPGSVLKLEKLDGKVGEVIDLTEVLLVVDGDKTELDAKKLASAKVTAEIIDQKKDKKVIIFKKKRRQNYRRKNGHRQEITVVRIKDVLASGAKKADSAKKASEPKEAKTETKAKAPKKATKSESAKK